MTFEPPALKIDLVTTLEDARAQRRLREQIRPFPLDRMDDLSPVDLFPFTPNHRTSQGWEPFRLPSAPEAAGERKREVP